MEGGPVHVKALIAGAARLGLRLDEAQAMQFRRYYRELAEWNSRINLTGIAGCEDVQAKHFLDSLSVSQAMPVEAMAGGALADVGSGAGFPGLPLKIACPGLRVTLVESIGKKAAFLRHVVGAMGLDGVEVLAERAETLAHRPHLREAFDVVTARAVVELDSLAELTLPLCRVGGRVIAQKKLDVSDELGRAERAIAILGGRLEEIVPVNLDEIGEQRCLVVLAKVSPSPAEYPRRPGMPAKRPL